jgi:hypothetical protein
MCLVCGDLDQSQDATEVKGKYFYFMTTLQMPLDVKARQREFAASAWLKLKIFLIPQPPLYFGFANDSQLQWCICGGPCYPTRGSCG